MELKTKLLDKIKQVEFKITCYSHLGDFERLIQLNNELSDLNAKVLHIMTVENELFLAAHKNEV